MQAITIGALKESIVIEPPVRVLKKGSNSNTAGTASNTAIKEIKTDSPRNCPISDDLTAPATLRTPISRALRIDLAVVRLIKFMQAINCMKKTIVNSKYRNRAFETLSIWEVIPLECR